MKIIFLTILWQTLKKKTFRTRKQEEVDNNTNKYQRQTKNKFEHREMPQPAQQQEGNSGLKTVKHKPFLIVPLKISRPTGQTINFNSSKL